jgi:ferric-dicitrate binding protein FerR (iron transport regulator)
MSTTLAGLLEKYRNGTITPAEWQLLREAVASDRLREPIQNDILQVLQNGAPDAGWNATDAGAILQKILEAAPDPAAGLTPAFDPTPAPDPAPAPAPIHRIHFLRRPWLRYAAAVLLLLGAGGYAWLLYHPKTNRNSIAASIPKTISAASNGALLTLADGSTITLDSTDNRTVAAQGGVQVTIRNGRLVYKPQAGKDADPANTPVLYNTVTTTKGNQFHIVLPDGTTVYLNAGTTLRYPTSFTGNQRRVDISGEAWFEVAKHADQPFVVSIDKGPEIEVLGTSFNVNAYKDESSFDATLVEGSIRVVKESRSVIVKPGQQARIANSGTSPPSTGAASQSTRAGEKITLIPNADIDKALAWKNGIFDFEGVGLHEMMRQLERWYDIEVVYEQNLPDIKFFGKISRKLDLATVLEALKGFGLHYEMKENRKLTVML